MFRSLLKKREVSKSSVKCVYVPWISFSDALSPTKRIVRQKGIGIIYTVYGVRIKTPSHYFQVETTGARNRQFEGDEATVKVSGRRSERRLKCQQGLKIFYCDSSYIHELDTALCNGIHSKLIQEANHSLFNK